ncbi:MAG: hypothetical protein NZ879_08170, partial [Archaeoglobaceae archaeon]|nr:hypothetical protein [Archaeoglobaceae archaeon]MDW8118940.1 GTP-binding protein [Archaeoglobaceae archaeon]
YFAENLRKKVVIVVNEIGEVGVDGDFLKKSGMNSYEITEGCICCTLRRDLESTLADILDKISPDYILIEPTGIAFPSTIRRIIRKMEMDALVIGVADAVRFSKLYGESREFIERQLKEAEIIALNKIDAVKSRAEIDFLVELLKGLNPHAELVFTSAKTGDGFDELIKKLDLPFKSIEETFETFIDSTAESGTTWYSGKFLISFRKPIPATELRRIGIEIMEEMKNSAGSIQHYKMLISSKSGTIKFGLTRKDENVSFDGEIVGWIVDATLNVLLVDRELDSWQIGKEFEERLKEKAKKFGFEVKKEERGEGEKE